MKTTLYLYGAKASEFADLPYRKALAFRAKAAHNLAGRLYEVNYLSRDNHRLNSVLKAEKYNIKLLKELDDEDKIYR